MNRTSAAGHLGHLFVPEDIANNRPPTEITADDLNAHQEELINVILAAGMVPDAGNNAQVADAIQRLTFGKNILLNTNFEYPVNQRVKASRVTTAGDYNFDCWYYGADTKFYQPADYINLSASQKYTLNWSGTATAEYLISAVGSSTIEAQGGWTAIVKGAQIITPADMLSGSKYLWVRWTGVTGALATFDKPVLVEGAIAKTCERKFFDQAIRECQRYYEIVSHRNGVFSADITSGALYSVTKLFKVRKQRQPTADDCMMFASGAVGFPASASLFNVADTDAIVVYRIANATTAGGYFSDDVVVDVRI